LVLWIKRYKCIKERHNSMIKCVIYTDTTINGLCTISRTSHWDLTLYCIYSSDYSSIIWVISTNVNMTHYYHFINDSNCTSTNSSKWYRVIYCICFTSCSIYMIYLSPYWMPKDVSHRWFSFTPSNYWFYKCSSYTYYYFPTFKNILSKSWKMRKLSYQSLFFTTKY